jgi:hypothetical protein
VEQKLQRALSHLMQIHAGEAHHGFSPLLCDGCKEIAGFLTVPGYQGGDHPVIR